MLGLGGPPTTRCVTSLQSRATDVTMVRLENTGHWLTEECPHETVKALIDFLQ